MKNSLAMINMGIMTPFPGTDIYDMAKKENKFFDYDWEHYTGANLVWNHPTMSKKQIEENYDRFRKKFYSWSSIMRRFWPNRAQPMYYFAMNFIHWWRAHHVSKPSLPSVAPCLPSRAVASGVPQ